MKKSKPIWEVLYNPMVEESGYVTISVHESRAGADKAMADHKEAERAKWLKENPTRQERERFPFGKWEDWTVVETELLP